MRSIVDNISEKLAPIYRKLNDLNVNTLLGVECEVLRINTTVADVMGETQESVKASIISNAIISYPYSSNVQIFDSFNEVTNTSDNNSVDIWDFLPITLKVPFESNIEESSSEIKRNDIIIHLLYDSNKKIIPITMQCTKVFGSFYVKSMIAKKFEMTLYRGILSSSIREEINIYINSKI